MTTDLQTRNDSLQRQLDQLLAEARRNEEKMRRFDLFERRLIGARSLAELVGLLLVDYKAAFGLAAVSLALVDPEYEFARLLEADQDEGGFDGGLMYFETIAALNERIGEAREIRLAPFDPEAHAPLFEGPQALGSLALLPLLRQGELIGCLSLGAADLDRFRPEHGVEFLSRLAAVVAMCLENMRNHELLKLVGLTDPLTDVRNRRYFEQRCQEEIAFACRYDAPLSCMFVDIDKFKRINDRLGHQAGDAVLSSIARLIKAQLRGSDVLARYGGEEFVILLPQTGGGHAADIAERIRAAVAARLVEPVPGGERLLVTVSIGVASLAGGNREADAVALAEGLVAAADQALYQAKENGRNRVVCSATAAKCAVAPSSRMSGPVRRWLEGARRGRPAVLCREVAQRFLKFF